MRKAVPNCPAMAAIRTALSCSKCKWHKNYSQAEMPFPASRSSGLAAAKPCLALAATAEKIWRNFKFSKSLLSSGPTAIPLLRHKHCRAKHLRGNRPNRKPCSPKTVRRAISSACCLPRALLLRVISAIGSANLNQPEYSTHSASFTHPDDGRRPAGGPIDSVLRASLESQTA